MSDSGIPPRPQTPQVLLHRLPDKTSDSDPERKPSKYIILIEGSTWVAGKIQIASSVAKALSCHFYQGDSMHESSAKAASVGASRPVPVAAAGSAAPHAAFETAFAGASGGREGPSTQTAAAPTSGPNEARYQRMWLTKLTRTGLLFPEESRPATEGFSGFGGTSSTSTSRRGSASSIASVSSNPGPASSVVSSRSDSMSYPHAPLSVAGALPPDISASGLNAVSFKQSREKELRRKNPALMVLTHLELEPWHRLAIRAAVGDYGIGVIFVPLEERVQEEDEEDLPILRPLDPTTMTSFPISFGSFAKKPRGWGTLNEEMRLRINVEADVEGQIDEIVEEVKYVMGVEN